MYAKNPIGNVIRATRAMRQSSANIYVTTARGTSRFDVISGNTCASVVSMLSTFSTMMFFNAPDGLSSTYPKGTRVSLAAMRRRIIEMVENADTCDTAVDA